MNPFEFIRSMPHDVIANVLDLMAFVFVTPELIGEARLNKLAAWIQRLFGGENRTLIIVVALIVAGRTARYLGFPTGLGHILVLAGIAFLIVVAFGLINRFVKTTPSRQVMLVLGAALFVTARFVGIFAALS